MAVIAMGLGGEANAAEPNKNQNWDETTVTVPIVKGKIDEYTDLVYSQVRGRGASLVQMHMNVLVPEGREPKPCVIFYPGGGFTAANHNKCLDLRYALAEAGYVVASAEYRTVPAVYPAIVEDAKTAIRYLRANARTFGIDPSRIGVLGQSAGGYVVNMLGVTNGDKSLDKGEYLDQSSDVKAVVTMYGISNLLNIGEGFPEEIVKVHQSPAATEALLLNGAAFGQNPGASVLSDPEKTLAASPMGHVRDGLPPFLIMYGTNDRLVSPEQSKQLFEAMKKTDTHANLVVVKGAGHGDITWSQPQIFDIVVKWLDENLK